MKNIFFVIFSILSCSLVAEESFSLDFTYSESVSDYSAESYSYHSYDYQSELNHHQHNNHNHQKLFSPDNTSYFDSDNFPFSRVDNLNNLGFDDDEVIDEDLEHAADQLPFLPSPRHWLRRAQREYGHEHFKKCLKYINFYEKAIIAQGLHVPGVLSRNQRAIIASYRHNCKKFLKEECHHDTYSISHFDKYISYNEFESYYDKYYSLIGDDHHHNHHSDYSYSFDYSDDSYTFLSDYFETASSSSSDSDISVHHIDFIDQVIVNNLVMLVGGEAIKDCESCDFDTLILMEPNLWNRFSKNIEVYAYLACGYLYDNQSKIALMRGLTEFDYHNDGSFAENELVEAIQRHL